MIRTSPYLSGLRERTGVENVEKESGALSGLEVGREHSNADQNLTGVNSSITIVVENSCGRKQKDGKTSAMASHPRDYCIMRTPGAIHLSVEIGTVGADLALGRG